MARNGSIERVVVIGGVAAGMTAASQAKRRSPETEVVLLERGDFISYGLCGIPYNLMDRARPLEDLVVLEVEEARNKRKIDVRMGYEVTAIDLGSQSVYAEERAKGREYAIRFDRLVFATGAAPVVPNIDGVDRFEGIFTVRSLAEAGALKAFLAERQPKRALVVGCGPTGIELSHALAELGVQVTIAEKEDHILPAFASSVSREVLRELAEHEVRVETGCSVLFFKGEGKRLSGAETTRGWVEADMVILATGMKPRSGLAAQAGIRLGLNGAIETDQRQETSVKGVYAAGDCSTTWHRLMGRNDYFPLGSTANKQGRVAGANATGADVSFPGILGSIAFRAFGLDVGRTGLTEAQAYEQGHSVAQTTIRTSSRGHHFPGAREITLRLLYDDRKGLVLGADVVGGEGVSRRVDVIATALHAGMRLDDLFNLDLSYSPPLGPVWDPVLVAATVAKKTLL